MKPGESHTVRLLSESVLDGKSTLSAIDATVFFEDCEDLLLVQLTGFNQFEPPTIGVYIRDGFLMVGLYNSLGESHSIQLQPDGQWKILKGSD